MSSQPYHTQETWACNVTENAEHRSPHRTYLVQTTLQKEPHGLESYITSMFLCSHVIGLSLIPWTLMSWFQYCKNSFNILLHQPPQHFNSTKPKFVQTQTALSCPCDLHASLWQISNEVGCLKTHTPERPPYPKPPCCLLLCVGQTILSLYSGCIG